MYGTPPPAGADAVRVSRSWWKNGESCWMPSER
jgi:hypothetical protein